MRQLEYVVAVAREEHFGRAAASCWVSQPTLSDQISRLEAELGVLIIRRGRRYEGLTPEGERLVAWARRVLSERDELLAEFARGRPAGTSRLRLGVIPTALPAVPVLTAAFRRPYPDVGVAVASLSADEIVRRLTAFELDAGLTYLDTEPISDEVRGVPLFVERYLLVTPVDGPLAGREEASWSEAAEQRLCLLSQEMRHRRILDDRFRQEGITVAPEVETDSLTVLMAHLHTGEWSSIVSQSWLRRFGAPARTRAIPLTGSLVAATIGLLVLARDPVPTMVRALLDAVADPEVRRSFAAAPESAG